MQHADPASTTVAVAIFAGVLALDLAHRLRVPAIVVLLLGGVLLGPSGAGLIQPGALGDLLGVVVALAVAIVLFEGGLTLDPRGLRESPRTITRLLTVGVLVTWLGSGLLVHLTFGLPPSLSLLAGSLIIVTGPTVISPLLRRVRVGTRLQNILHWEAVLVDPVGVFVAVLTFEWVTAAAGASSLSPVAGFVLRLGLGASAGVAVGFLLDAAIRRNWISDDLVNLTIFGTVIALFQGCNALLTESGLLAVTAAGLVIGLRQPPRLDRLRTFKLQLTELAVAVLFMLLAANLDLRQFLAFGTQGLLLIGLILLLVRPLNVLLSTAGTDVSWRERAFLAWVAPRGIVAASMASLFALRLGELGYAQAAFVETFTYAVIAATVLLQALSAGWVASLLGVREPPRRDWLLVGAHGLALGVARFVEERAGVRAWLVDQNAENVAWAQAEGVRAIHADATHTELLDEGELTGVGCLFALTDNAALNALIASCWASELGREGVHRWGEAGLAGDEHGTSRWAHLPSPSHLSHDLLEEELELRHLRPGDPRVAAGEVIAAASATGEVRLGRDAAALTGSDVWLLVLSPRASLPDLFDPGLMVLTEGPRAAAEVYALALEHASQAVPGLDTQSALDALARQREAFAVILGNGVALPHASTSALESPRCVVVQVKGGVQDLEGHDGVPIELVFLLLSPVHDPDAHLIALGEIARRVRQPSAARRLVEARDADELLTRLARPTPSSGSASGSGITFPLVDPLPGPKVSA